MTDQPRCPVCQRKNSRLYHLHCSVECDLRSEIRRHWQKIDQHKDTIAELEAENETLRNRIAEIASDYTAQGFRLVDLEMEVERLRQALKQSRKPKGETK
jgi:septal ring factor EnvC (AmiA/AmiB activator)